MIEGTHLFLQFSDFTVPEISYFRCQIYAFNHRNFVVFSHKFSTDNCISPPLENLCNESKNLCLLTHYITTFVTENFLVLFGKICAINRRISELFFLGGKLHQNKFYLDYNGPDTPSYSSCTYKV